MDCPGCGAPMRLEEDHLVCPFCARVEIPEPDSQGVRILGERSERTCPVCSIPLVHASIAGERILYCEHCLGMLLGMEQFLVVVQELHARYGTSPRRPKPLDERALDRRLTCPQCSQPMDTHPYGGPGNIIIDACENCGLNWLDYSELDRVARAADSSR